MTNSKTLEQLVEQHAQRAYQLVHDTLDRFHGLESPKVQDALSIFIAQNGQPLSSDLAKSMTDTLDEAMQRNLPVNENFIDTLRMKNLDAAAMWQSEYKNLYDSLPAAI